MLSAAATAGMDLREGAAHRFPFAAFVNFVVKKTRLQGSSSIEPPDGFDSEIGAPGGVCRVFGPRLWFPFFRAI